MLKPPLEYVQQPLNTDHGLLRRWIYLACSSPWVELLGMGLGIGTGWYLRQRGSTVKRLEREEQGQRQRQHQRELQQKLDPRAISSANGEETADGVDLGSEGLSERSALLERLARGLPVLGATWLWQLLNRLDGPPSLLDPIAAILAWLFFDMVLLSIPPSLWTRWDLGKPQVAAARPSLALPPPGSATSTPLSLPMKPDETSMGVNYIEEVAPLTPAREEVKEVVTAGAAGCVSSVSCDSRQRRQSMETTTTAIRDESVMERENGVPSWPTPSIEQEEKVVTACDEGTRELSMTSAKEGPVVKAKSEELAAVAAGSSLRDADSARRVEEGLVYGQVRPEIRSGSYDGALGGGSPHQLDSSPISHSTSSTTTPPRGDSVKRRSRSEIGLVTTTVSAGTASSPSHSSRTSVRPPRRASVHVSFPGPSTVATNDKATPCLMSSTNTPAVPAAAEVASASNASSNPADGVGGKGSSCSSSKDFRRPSRRCRRQHAAVEPTAAPEESAASSSLDGCIGSVSAKRRYCSNAGSPSPASPTSTAVIPAAKKGRQTEEGLSRLKKTGSPQVAARRQFEREDRRWLDSDHGNNGKNRKDEASTYDINSGRCSAQEGPRDALVSSASGTMPVVREPKGGAATTEAKGQEGRGKEVMGWRGRDREREPLMFGDFDGKEEGTPVPAEFRPPERERDVLCKWSLSQLRKDEEVGMFARGAFGKVVAMRTENNRPIAMKVVKNSGLSPERYIERELKILEECSVHPHVVGLHGVIRTEKLVYVLMPFADTDLAAMIKSTCLDEKQAGFCVRQLVSAVEFLHGRGVVHRDIKPANVLVLSNKVLLADFGLAREIPRGKRREIVGACGTKPYMAPELVRDLPYDESVDLWAVGVLTFELLHGYTPFKPKLNFARSWNGVVREKRLVANSGKGEISGSNAESVSISESSGSIVNRRMFERSAPAAPGGGLEGAWLAGQPHEALLLGEEDEEGRVDGGHAWRGKGRRGHSEADQLRLLDNIVRGKYRIQRDRVGDVGVDFIQQEKLLQTAPALRMSALRAAEHPWLGRPSKVHPRRRAARAEVAAITAERAYWAAERHKARVQSFLWGSGPTSKSGTTALSDIAQLAAAMAAEARAAQADAKRWEKVAAEAEAEAGREDAGGGTGALDIAAVTTAVSKAEAAVKRAELLGKEAQAGEAAAAAAAAAMIVAEETAIAQEHVADSIEECKRDELGMRGEVATVHEPASRVIGTPRISAFAVKN